MMRDDSVARVDLRIRSETLLELHAGLVQLWMYCAARETGSCAGSAYFEINVADVTHEVLTTLSGMFRKAGVAVFLNSATPIGCSLGAYRTVVSTHTIAFTLIPPPPTRCSGR